MKYRIAVISVLTVIATGCSEAAEQPVDAASSAPALSASAAVLAELPETEVATALQYVESDFVESDDVRDPFRNYTSLFRKPTDDLERINQRKVKAYAYSLDELKLVAIIARSNNRAMLDDPSGFGWIIYTGDFVGRSEFVSTGGIEAQEVGINWRVDRIRATDVVFVREDVSHPEIPATTRVIPLYAPGEARGGS
ncbi:MAG: pilus assembly protein PilP [Myxococcales bacterium]|nr:pilus assembly protein PilP [Myxococcales bacterium]